MLNGSAVSSCVFSSRSKRRAVSSCSTSPVQRVHKSSFRRSSSRCKARQQSASATAILGGDGPALRVVGRAPPRQSACQLRLRHRASSPEFLPREENEICHPCPGISHLFPTARSAN